MGSRLRVLATVLSTALTIGCSPRARIPIVEQTQMVMGTFFTVALYGKVQPDSAERAIAAAFDTIRAVEMWASASSPRSEVRVLNLRAGRDTVDVSAPLDRLLHLAQKVAQASDGAFDVTVGPLTSLWGFEDSPTAPPDSAAIRAALRLVDYRDMWLGRRRAFLRKPGMQLDLGAIAKGWAVDRAFALLRQRGYGDVMVDGGGDLRVASTSLTAGKRRVWIRHPRRPGNYIGRFPYDSGAVATSGDYERYFLYEGVRFHHILDPRSGWPARACASVTVVGPNTTLCDAWATAIFVLGPRRGLEIADQIPGLEAMVVSEANGRLYWDATEALAARLEILDPAAVRGFPE